MKRRGLEPSCAFETAAWVWAYLFFPSLLLASLTRAGLEALGLSNSTGNLVWLAVVGYDVLALVVSVIAAVLARDQVPEGSLSLRAEALIAVCVAGTVTAWGFFG